MTSPPIPQPAELARLVREAREALDMTQQQVAAATNGLVSYSYLRMIEAGRRTDGRPLRISAPRARALAAALALDEQKALELAGHPFNPAVSQQRVVAAVTNLPPHLQQAVTVIANELHARHAADPQKAIA